MELRALALKALELVDPEAKVAAVRALQAGSAANAIVIDTGMVLPVPAGLPGRPPRPRLVPVQQLPRRSPAPAAGRAALLHALTHIEFNAINLALDAIWRFPELPAEYYLDWLRVADEEATHFSLLREHLRTLDCDYGDFDAHDGLWTMAERTAGDVLARMALVPRTMEARGLDATPPIRAKFARAGDERAVAILDIILREEIGHVAIGNRWFGWLCAQRSFDPLDTYSALAARCCAPRPKPPFNLQARRAAGFTDAELFALGR